MRERGVRRWKGGKGSKRRTMCSCNFRRRRSGVLREVGRKRGMWRRERRLRQKFGVMCWCRVRSVVGRERWMGKRREKRVRERWVRQKMQLERYREKCCGEGEKGNQHHVVQDKFKLAYLAQERHLALQLVKESVLFHSTLAVESPR